MKFKVITLLVLITCISISSFSQSKAYKEKKTKALQEDSPFTKIIKRQLPAAIEYEDDEIIAFVPLRKQAPIHFLIVPKKPITSINDIENDDVELLGKMYLVAKKIAKTNGIAESGYRLVINNNEDAGQSVFHIHMHLLGGKKLGPMITQDYNED